MRPEIVLLMYPVRGENNRNQRQLPTKIRLRQSYSDRKYADALGKNAVTDNEFFIESSSGFEKENHNKKAGIDTIIKKCTLGVQVIKKTLTLTKVTLSKTGKWRLIEVRSSCTPTCWELRSHWKPLFEMMATIYLELLEQRSLDKIIM
ncbi:hypothetical protein RO3G_11573 [Rhizopus delemar RA 99-880]|uniref:Uncharacterized protein n=1 Tax=Rhizopus delemar (strain RA 99-880 / ATCC MYA-4621 / FGSC 9543 / NRRL 43880) TaxID=246409 RepID=I1CEI2_RHIO9|nr:hypothetical protein RO3G_11573 [Rhizopus delemar RA 99-880]|eukprot:EIE86862.1 hypothetical protein RO3G_11573 [Rhizopus delemar RA 99-880]